jgi:hypothetical protein
VLPAIHGKDECISPGTFIRAMRIMKVSKSATSPHGLRSTASTLLNKSR